MIEQKGVSVRLGKIWDCSAANLLKSRTVEKAELQKCQRAVV